MCQKDRPADALENSRKTASTWKHRSKRRLLAFDYDDFETDSRKVNLPKGIGESFFSHMVGKFCDLASYDDES